MPADSSPILWLLQSNTNYIAHWQNSKELLLIPDLAFLASLRELLMVSCEFPVVGKKADVRFVDN